MRLTLLIIRHESMAYENILSLASDCTLCASVPPISSTILRQVRYSSRARELSRDGACAEQVSKGASAARSAIHVRMRNWPAWIRRGRLHFGRRYGPWQDFPIHHAVMDSPNAGDLHAHQILAVRV